MGLISIKKTIQEIAEKHEFFSLSREITEKFSDETISIALVGEFSSGKSTITNALLGRKLLPSFEEPTTAAIVEVVVGQKFNTSIMVDGKKEEIQLSDLNSYIVEKHQNVEKVIITIPETEFLTDGMKIIDTPGIDSIENTHQDITFGYLPFVDAILLVMNINKGGMTDSLRTFLTKKIIDENDLKKVYILLNWSDTKSQKEIEFITEDVRKNVKDIIQEPIIISLSGKRALEKDTEAASNIMELKEVLNQILSSKKELVDRRLSHFLAQKRQALVQLLNEKLSIKDIDDSALEGKISDSKKRIDEFEEVRNAFVRGKRQLEKNIHNEIDRQLSLHCNAMISASLEGNQDSVNFYAETITNEIKKIVDREITVFNFPIVLNKENGVSSVIKTQIDIEISKWRDSINTVSPIITAVILAAFTGPAGIAMTEVSLETITIVLAKVMKDSKLDLLEELKKEIKGKDEKADNNQSGNVFPTVEKTDETVANQNDSPNENTEEDKGGARGGLKVAARTVANLIAKLDLANKGMKFAVQKMKKEQIQNSLSDSMKGSVGNTLNDLFLQIDNHIKMNVIQPQKEFEKILEDTREERKNLYSKIVEIKKDLEKDINHLNLLL
jgi:GTPase SAR1 family protein